MHRSEKLGASGAHNGTAKGLTTSVADLHHLILHAPRSQVIKVKFVYLTFSTLKISSRESSSGSYRFGTKMERTSIGPALIILDPLNGCIQKI
jgi:hypothetical protein